jgi:hypothetical protein
MRKLTLFSLIFLLISGYSVQAQFSWGVEGGAVFSKAKTNASDPALTINQSSSGVTGYMGGLIVDIPFGDEKLRVIPELLYVNHGVNTRSVLTGVSEQATVDAKWILNSLTLPVNLAVAWPIGDQKLILGGGPYMSLGMSGKRSTKVQSNIIPGGVLDTVTTKVFGSASDQLKSLDYGINIMGIFMLWNGLAIKANYSYGIANLSNNSQLNYRNRYFSVGLSYFFH